MIQVGIWGRLLHGAKGIPMCFYKSELFYCGWLFGIRKCEDPKKCKNMGKYDAMIARNACSTSRLHQGQDTQADSSALNWIILLIPRM